MLTPPSNIVDEEEEEESGMIPGLADVEEGAIEGSEEVECSGTGIGIKGAFTLICSNPIFKSDKSSAIDNRPSAEHFFILENPSRAVSKAASHSSDQI